MRNIVLTFTILFLSFSCKEKSLEKTNPNTTSVKGKATTDYIGKVLHLKYIQEDSVYTKIDTVSPNMEFEFTITDIQYPAKAFLTDDLSNYAPKVIEKNQLGSLIFFQFGTPSVPLQFGHPKDLKFLLLEEGNINIQITDSIYNSKISNSILNDELQTLSKNLAPAMFKINMFNKNDFRSITDKKIFDSLNEARQKIDLEKSKIIDKHISNHKQSYSSVFAFNIKPFLEETDLSIFKTIALEIRNSKLAEPGRMKLERFLNTKVVSDTIENFTLPNQEGKQISLKDIKSKYILIDFWASWCLPCRKESKAISQFYSDFSKEDFQIVGVSVDKDKNKWIKALKEDNIQWLSLIDSDNVINDKLGVSYYPTTFLLNSDLEIIDKNLGSEKLRERLIQLLE